MISKVTEGEIRPSSLGQNFVFLVASLLIFSIATFGCIRWLAMASYKRFPFVTHWTWLEEQLTEKPFIHLVEAVRSSEQSKFSTLWDFNDRVLLSRNLFLEENMYGEIKFRYKPNIGVYNIIVWSGVASIRFVTAETPEIRDRLKKCKVLRRVQFKTDRFGFKPTQFQLEPSSSTILFLGDSFTEGYWVSPENTFVNLIGSKLKSDGIDLVPVNMGVGGYSALEMSWMLEHFVPLLHPKMVVLNLFPNDVDVNYIAAVKGEEIPEENYQQMFHYLDLIRIYCERSTIDLIISVIPAKQQFRKLAKYGYFQKRMNQWCKENYVNCLDPREYFKKFRPRKIYFFWDPHFSEEGHRHYADFLYDEIINLNPKAMTTSKH